MRVRRSRIVINGTTANMYINIRNTRCSIGCGTRTHTAGGATSENALETRTGSLETSACHPIAVTPQCVRPTVQVAAHSRTLGVTQRKGMPQGTAGQST